MKKVLLGGVLSAAIVVFGCSVAASTDEQTKLSAIEVPVELAGKPTLDLSFGRTAAQLMGWTLDLAPFQNEESKAAVADMLDQVNEISVRVYEYQTNPAWESFAQDSLSRFSKAGWETAVAINEDHERVFIMTSLADQSINGLTIMVFNDSEAVLLTFDGTISPQQLAKLME